MAEAVQGPAPSGPRLLALLAAPEHCFARMARDLLDTPRVSAATLEVRLSPLWKDFLLGLNAFAAPGRLTAIPLLIPFTTKRTCTCWSPRSTDAIRARGDLRSM